MPFRSRSVDQLMPRRVVGSLALALSLALGGALLPPPVASAAADRSTELERAKDPVPVVKGTTAKPAGRPANTMRKTADPRLDKPSWPGRADAEITVAAANTKAPREVMVGSLPVAAAAVKGEKEAASPDKIAVEVLDATGAKRLGASAVLKVEHADDTERSAPVRLDIDYASFAEGYGGSYGSRLRLVELPACAVVATPGSKACPATPKVLKTINDPQTQTLSAVVTAPPRTTRTAVGAPGLFAVAAGPSSAQGTYKATALAPSSSWNVAASSGGFSWNYPLKSVPTPGGLVPTVGLGYSSQAADGRTAATNNQGSWVGDGFSYDPGYIERRYKPCSEDGHSSSGEQCWAFENATILLNGQSSELVQDDTTKKWHLSSDDGAKVEKRTGATNGDNDGEHWVVTTTDGTEYYFGLNQLPGWAEGNEETKSAWTSPVFGDDKGEPCYNATFASAHCKQAWRWSLDYVKDTHGNVMSYFYEPETNHYALNGKTDVAGTAYHRGGYLKRIDYGQRDGQLYATKAPARIDFQVAERCLPTDTFDCAPSKRTKSNAANWPDVPVDQECAAGAKCTVGQTFFTTKRLTGITSQISEGTTGYRDVDHWSLAHQFHDNGDDSKTLWLNKIQHEGRDGTAVKMPAIELSGEQLANRVDAIGDNIAPFHRYRLSTVVSETGSQLDVNYAATNCTKSALPKPGESTKRCYPVKWAPPGYLEPITDWFHKYVVAEISETDRTGGSESTVTRYDYQGNAAWRKTKPDGITEDKFLTWGSWQGYGKVSVTSGTADKQSTRVDYTYLQGMDGDKDADGATRTVKVKDSQGTEHTDAEEYTGQELESVTYDGSAIASRTISQPWKHNTATQTRSWGTRHAVISKPRVQRGFTPLSSGGWRETKSTTTYDTTTRTGRVTQVEDLGDVSIASDDTCTRTSYADNVDKNILSLPSRSEVVTVKCATTPDRSRQVLADERTFYDNGAFGASPTKGDVSKTERMTAHNGTTANYQTTGTTGYDGFGRPLWQKDAKNYETKTRYTETNGLLVRTAVTNAANHVTTTDYNPARGASTGQSDPNGVRTDLAHDALGRLTSVWLPDRAKSQTPSIKYSYLVRTTKPTVIKTEKVEHDGTYGAEFELFDSFLRGRQKQTEGPGGTRMVADAWYDGVGKVVKTNATYRAAGAPGDELLIVGNGGVGAQTRAEYDGLGRPTAEISLHSGTEQWRSTTRYDGELIHSDPPTGGVASTAVTDADGRTTALRHYHGDRPDPLLGYDETKYTYTPNGQLKTVTDAKNNVWTYEYDQLGRKTKSIDPDAGTSTTHYDELDRVQWTIDGNGKKVSTQYDSLSRPTFTWEGEPTTGTKLTETRYDKAGWLGHAWASMRYVNATQYIGSSVTSMDELYRPLKTVYAIPGSEGALGGTYEFTTSYNRDGTVRGTGMPAAGGLPAEALAYGYDELQRPTTLTGTTSYVTGTTYSGISQVTGMELYTGSGKKVGQTFEYEAGTGRLRTATVDVAGATNPVKRSSYSYDQVGNVLSIADTANTGSSATTDVQCFAYDTGARLKEAWTPAASAATAQGAGTVGSNGLDASKPSACDAAPGTNALNGPAPYWKSYSVDAIGNRTKDVTHDIGGDKTKDITRTYSYGGAGAAGDGPHQVTKVVENTPTGENQSTYTYDDAGNTKTRVLGGNTQTLEWNATGQPAKIKTSAGESTFIYGPDGSRMVRKDPKATTVYLPGMELSLAAGSTTVKATRYYSHAGQTVAVRTSDNKLSFLASDHHGTGELAVDAASGAITQRRSDPYGVDRGEASGSWPGEKGYVGGTIDASTGLTHIGARSYDAQLGKFISVDPIIDYTRPQQINGYAYADNSPVTLSDPSGLYADCGAYDPRSCSHTPIGNRADADEDAAEENRDDAAAGKAAAEQQFTSAKQSTIRAAKAIVKILMDEIGITAGLDCLSTGDLGACGETVLNIAGSFAGGIAGKLLAKYGAPWNWEKGAKLLKRVVGLVDDIVGGISGMISASKKVTKAKEALAKAESALEAAKKRAAEASSGICERHSFLPDTKVLTANGKTKRIKDVKLGEKIIATDPKTGRTTVREVVRTITTEDDKDFVDLTIATKPDGAGSKFGKGDHPADPTSDGASTATLTSTVNHPFWSPSERKWIEAGDLTPGMTLRTADGDTATVVGNRAFEQRQRTHDLTIRDVHTYYVLAGVTPVLVHNCDGGTPSAPAGEASVHLDRPNGHALISIRSGDEVLSTHQFGGADLPTNGVATFDPATLSPTTINVRVPLPNPGGAMAYAEVMMSRTARGTYPAYNLESQSCVTYCAQVLRAGGVSDIPLDTFSATRWLIRRHG
ncbi:RHS repeat-associated core domain-containing protein [Streptomyces rubiginosohelvolus]|uniref:RHS repeat-associated core domain-containing protein n=1 Tax=Streptomyces rubiginosohelvolus TaxID=67362 RepID=UPI0036BD794F